MLPPRPNAPSGQEKLDAVGLEVGAGRVKGRGAQRVHQVDVGTGAQQLGDDGLAMDEGRWREFGGG